MTATVAELNAYAVMSVEGANVAELNAYAVLEQTGILHLPIRSELPGRMP
jgi:hypothetical protein